MVKLGGLLFILFFNACAETKTTCLISCKDSWTILSNFFMFLQVVEEPYTMREARIHVRHVRDLLKSLDPADAYNGVDCSSLSFLNVVTQGDILGMLTHTIQLLKNFAFLCHLTLWDMVLSLSVNSWARKKWMQQNIVRQNWYLRNIAARMGFSATRCACKNSLIMCSRRCQNRSTDRTWNVVWLRKEII